MPQYLRKLGPVGNEESKGKRTIVEKMWGIRHKNCFKRNDHETIGLKQHAKNKTQAVKKCQSSQWKPWKPSSPRFHGLVKHPVEEMTTGCHGTKAVPTQGPKHHSPELTRGRRRRHVSHWISAHPKCSTGHPAQ